MKKITALFALLMLVCMGAQAQTATLMEGYGDPLTLTQFKAMAGTGQRFGFVASSNTAAATAPRCDHWCGFSSTHTTTTLSDDYLFYLETSGDNYLVKRCSDDQYVISDASTTTFGAAGTAFKLVERNPNDATAAVWNTQSISFENPSDGQYHYNANAVKMNTGPGAWTTYAVFGPIWKEITIDCQENGVSMEGYPQEFTYKAGTVEAPVFPGKKLVDGEPTSVTVSEDNQTITFNYESSSFDYTLVVNGAPEGTTITIKGEPVSAGAVSFDSEVTESDVVVTFSTGFESYVATVTINGTTITVNCAYKQTVITEVSEITSNKLYTVETQGRGAWTMASDGSALRSTKASGVSTTAKQWAFVTYETNTYLYNVETKKFILKNSANASAEATHGTPVTIVKYTSDQMDGWGASFDDFQASGHYFAAQMGTDGDYTAYINFGGSMQTTVDGWGPGNAPGYNAKCGADAGNALRITEVGEFDPTEALTALDNYFNPQYTITYVVKEGEAELFRSEPVGTTLGATITTLPEEYQRPLFYTYNTVDVTITETGNTDVVFLATTKDDAPVKFTADATNPYYYNLNIRSQYLVFDETNEDKVKLQATSEPFNPNAAWAFIGNPYAGFSVINQVNGASNVLTYTTVTTDRPTTHNIQFQTGAEAEAKTWLIDTNPTGIVLRMKENTNIYFHHENGAVKYLRTCSLSEWWNVHNDTGSTIIATTDMEALVQLYNLLKDAPIGEGPNKYSATGVNPEEILTNAGTVIDNEESSQYYDTYQALLNLQSAMTLNLPKAGFYRIKGNTSGMYLAAGKTSGKFSMSNAVDATTIFCFDGTKLINYSDGMVNGMNSTSWDWVYGNGDVSTVTFQDGLTMGGYGIRCTKASGDNNANFYDNGDNSASADRGGNVTINENTNSRYTSWYLEEVKELPVTLHESETKEGYSVWIATFSAPVSVVSVEGAEIHKVSDTGSAFFCEPANVQGIPAGKGVLLVTDTETETATVTLGETSEDFETILQPLYACEKGKTGLFFGKVEGSQIAGLYPIDSERPTGGFKAFVDDSTGEGKELVFDQDPTGIENMEHGTLNMNNGAIYNLQGQKVNKAQKGVFIQNGKKVVLK